MAAKTKAEKAKEKAARQRERRRKGDDPIVRRVRFAKKTKPPPKKGGRGSQDKPGRPPIETDAQQIRRMASLGCSQWEISVILGISQNTLRDRLRNDPEVRAAYDLGQVDQFLNLRRLQWRHAKGPNGTPMTIHLSKHLLGQHDKSFILSLTVEELDDLIIQMEQKHATAIEGPQTGANAGEHSEIASSAANGSGKRSD